MCNWNVPAASCTRTKHLVCIATKYLPYNTCHFGCKYFTSLFQLHDNKQIKIVTSEKTCTYADLCHKNGIGNIQKNHGKKNKTKKTFSVKCCAVKDKYYRRS